MATISTDLAGNMSISGLGPAVVTLFISSEAATSERRFSKSITIASLKERLEPITGVPASTMKVSLYSKSDEFMGVLDDDSKMLGFFPVVDYARLQITDLNPHRVRGEYTDLSAVKKFELTEDEYNKRSDTLRDYLKRNKLRQYAETASQPDEADAENEFEHEAAGISVGDRCEVVTEEGLTKRGSVQFVGKTQFKPGYWVGIQYDEPLGKHNGTVKGVQYFSCPDKYGAFLRPNKVQVGDYPEEDLFGDEL
ncbi:CAP Gly-rich domain-containing protein [Polychytrium aggregatum]|uniref:CAP Gly-rich domain-containing protein n=1 Tax=Polychytrium aggregatum TaxID=110093 RepID=UPI0022FEFEB7|nr:CAP Gly-rich domain-containing protein [Polychytrium aggregatum]KAI9205921.1 CAP Gly-rich domain-containing protein [Polychytrium aggregatum]